MSELTMMATVTGPDRSQPHVATAEKTDEDELLGQFIPIHYHYQMLLQEPRIGGFENAINAVVKPGMKVLELGCGSGVLSFFAARAGASQVYTVERLPHVARAARGFLEANGVRDRVEVVNADGFDYLPPEPVDVVVCEMLHTAMLREKQLSIIKAFKERYLATFGGPLPIFIPEAAVLGMQLVFTNYDFHGYRAAVPMFVDGSGNGDRVVSLADPALYSSFFYSDDYSTSFDVEQEIEIGRTGMVNGVRFSTRNLLAILESEGRSIDWDMHDLILPISKPFPVLVGEQVQVRFRYEAGDSLLSLSESIDGRRS